jgi:hypothetical protein
MSNREDPVREPWERWQFGSTDLQDEAAGLPVPHRTLLRIELGLVVLTVIFLAVFIHPLPLIAMFVLAPAAVILGVSGMVLDWDLPVWWTWLGCTIAPIVATGLWWWFLAMAFEGG